LSTILNYKLEAYKCISDGPISENLTHTLVFILIVSCYYHLLHNHNRCGVLFYAAPLSRTEM